MVVANPHLDRLGGAGLKSKISAATALHSTTLYYNTILIIFYKYMDYFVEQYISANYISRARYQSSQLHFWRIIFLPFHILLKCHSTKLNYLALHLASGGKFYSDF